MFRGVRRRFHVWRNAPLGAFHEPSNQVKPNLGRRGDRRWAQGLRVRLQVCVVSSNRRPWGICSLNILFQLSRNPHRHDSESNQPAVDENSVPFAKRSGRSSSKPFFDQAAMDMQRIQAVLDVQHQLAHDLVT